MMANHTGISSLFERILKQFDLLIKKKGGSWDPAKAPFMQNYLQQTDLFHNMEDLKVRDVVRVFSMHRHACRIYVWRVTLSVFLPTPWLLSTHFQEKAFILSTHFSTIIFHSTVSRL